MSVRSKLLPAAVIVAAIAVAVVLVATKPRPAIETPTETGKVVQVHSVQRVTQRLGVAAKGTVIPAREVVLQPQVTGRVVTVGDNLVPGGLVSEGDLLFAIEQSDYRLSVEQARTRLAEAEAAFALEQGRQAVAEREWALFEDELLPNTDAALALREPQLKAAQAAVAAAQSQLEQAQINLRRTRIHAPFNAVVRAESIDPGQIVSPQTQAARLVGTDEFWVQVAIPVGELGLIDVASADQPGSSAIVRYDTGATNLQRAGVVVRRLADLDRAGQMARLLIAIEDPLDLEGTHGAALLLESFVDVDLTGNRTVDVARLRPEWVHNGGQVHVYENGTLAIRNVEVVWRQPDAVLVGAGLDNGDTIVTTTLSTPVIGMRLRLDNDSVATAERTP